MFMIKGNEDLKPEKNNYVSLGTEYSNDNFFISGNVYGNFFRKKIEGVWRIYDMQYNLNIPTSPSRTSSVWKPSCVGTSSTTSR